MNPKNKIEEKFHDEWAKTMDIKDVLVVPFFEAVTAVENQYVLQTFGDIKNKYILDLGCGAGEAAVYFALKGAFVTAADVSSEMLKVTKKVAKKHKVKIQTKKTTAEKMDFPSESFDFIFGNGILHHLEMDLALPEIKRVLKKGGQAAFAEPLYYNPVINIYRKKAGGVRTSTEKPITFDDIKSIKKIFPKVNHKEFWLTALLIFVYLYLIKRLDPSKVRYWKEIIKEAERYKYSFPLLNALDRLILDASPFLGRYCWNTVLVLQK